MAAEIDDYMPVTVVGYGQPDRRDSREPADVLVPLPSPVPTEVDRIEQLHVRSAVELDDHDVTSVGIKIVVEVLHNYLFFLPLPYGD